MNARKEVRGIDANNPANSDECFAISETTTTTIAVITTLIKIYTIS